MEYNTSFSTTFQEQCPPSESTLSNQQISYFPSLWTDTASVEFTLENSKAQIAPILHQTVMDIPTCYSQTRSPSESRSETSRHSSQEPRPEGKRDRRRAQNRAAQRAYRERKEQVRQELEVEVKEWRDKHQTLRQSYADQAHEVEHLKQHIDNLRIQLLAAQDTNVSDISNICDFDTWTQFDWKPS